MTNHYIVKNMSVFRSDRSFWKTFLNVAFMYEVILAEAAIQCS